MGNTVANQLADRLLENDPPADAPKKKEREVMRPFQDYQNARQSFRELKKLMAQRAETEAKLESSIAVRAELARHGLHPDDVKEYVTRQSVKSMSQQEYKRLGLDWKDSQPLDVVGVVMNDGQKFWFVEPVPAHPGWARSLAAQDYNRNRVPSFGKQRRGLPFTVIQVNDPEGHEQLKKSGAYDR